MAATQWEHWHRRTQTHTTLHSQPDKAHAQAHTLGVNAKASTLKGPLEARIHLWLHSGRPFAAHTKKRTRFYHTARAHTHRSTQQIFFHALSFCHTHTRLQQMRKCINEKHTEKKKKRMQIWTRRARSPVSLTGSDVVKVIGGSISACLQESCRQTHRGTTSAFLM